MYFVALTSNNIHAQVSTLESCLSSLQAWFCSNSMIMNPDKSNSVLFATTQRAHSLPDQISVNISGISIPLCNHVKILGAVLDSRLTLSQHTKAVSKSCFYYTRAFKQIRIHLTTQLSALLPLLLSLLDLIMLTAFYTAFQLNIPLVSSGHKTPLHVLSQVLALLTLAHPL